MPNQSLVLELLAKGVHTDLHVHVNQHNHHRQSQATVLKRIWMVQRLTGASALLSLSGIPDLLQCLRWCQNKQKVMSHAHIQHQNGSTKLKPQMPTRYLQHLMHCEQMEQNLLGNFWEAKGRYPACDEVEVWVG